MTIRQDHDSYGYQLGAMLCFLIFLDNLLRRIEGPGTTVWFWLSSGRWELILVFGALSVVCQVLFWSGVVHTGDRAFRGEWGSPPESRTPSTSKTVVGVMLWRVS